MPIFFLTQKKVFIWEENSIPTGLFRYTNMAAVRSYENKSVNWKKLIEQLALYKPYKTQGI